MAEIEVRVAGTGSGSGFKLKIKDSLEWQGKAQSASTIICLLGEHAGRLWWAVLPQTGRTHQIRKHFAHGDRVHHAEFDYTNDSDGIFAIDDGGPYRFFSLEAEHTNRVDCNNLQQTSFLKKFLAIQAIMDSRLYQKAWGLPHLLHLVVVPSQARIDTMKTLILRETNGKGVPYILFREIPVMEGFRPIRPMPELYTEPWQRAGYPALAINQRR